MTLLLLLSGAGEQGAVAAVLVVYEAFAYSQGTPAASVIEALSPAVNLKTNLSPAADVIQALSPDGNTRTNATPGAEVNSS